MLQISFRILTPEERGDRPWKYVVTRPFTWEMQNPLPVAKNFHLQHHETGQVLAQLLHGRTLQVMPGYAWDGATKWIDTMEGAVATVVHDPGYQMIQQFARESQYAVWKRCFDLEFRDILLLSGKTFWAHAEYWAVRLLGRPTPDDSRNGAGGWAI